MKKYKHFKLLLPALFVVFVAIVLAETLVVKVKTTNLRKEPVFYASTVAVLKAGDSVEKLSSQGGWYKVRTPQGMEGWLHSSSVQKKKFSLLAMDKSVKTGASAEEVALASKGFNKQVEAKYKANNPGISFAKVDRMLKFNVTASQLKDFLKKGKLGEFGGTK